jgi:hypothetical protein
MFGLIGEEEFSVDYNSIYTYIYMIRINSVTFTQDRLKSHETTKAVKVRANVDREFQVFFVEAVRGSISRM